MKKTNILDFSKGWFIGNFEPSLYKTPEFEVALKSYKVGDRESAHYHKVAKEYTVISRGIFIMKNTQIGPGDIIILDPGEIADFECLEDGETFVIKTPSLVGDKYVVNNK